MMAAWRETLVLAALLAVCSAVSYGYGYGYGHGHGGDYDPRQGPGMSLTAHFETGGIRGKICFSQPDPGVDVTITVELEGLDQFLPQRIGWGISTFPVKFSEYPDFPCAQSDIGGTVDPYGDLSGRHGGIRSDVDGPQVFVDKADDLSLFGPNSPVGRPVVLYSNRGPPIACANIEYQGISLQTLRASFNGPNLMGEVIFRRQNGRSGATLNVALYEACNSSLVDIGKLNWYLRVGSCDGPIFGNNTFPDEIHHGVFDDCSPEEPRACPGGDLTTKCGQLCTDGLPPRFRAFCHDDQLGLFPLSSIQSTYLVIETEEGVVLGCEPWDPVNQLCARVSCTKRPRLGIDILFFQYDPSDRTHVRSFITGLDMEKAFMQVRRDPIVNKNRCNAGGLYDKVGPLLTASNAENPTGEVLPVGTLENKITSIYDRQSLVKQDTSSWVPLFGPYSIIGRSIAIVDKEGNTAVCCNIEPVVDPDPALINSILGYQEETPLVG